MFFYILIFMTGLTSCYTLGEELSAPQKELALTEPGTIEKKLLSLYPAQPFHESIKDPMPVQKCETAGNRKNKRKKCNPIEIQYEDNPDKFNFILAETEKRIDTSNPRFLASPLGKKYKSLKKFMNIYNQFSSCSKEDPAQTDSTAQKLMDRMIRNISQHLTEHKECFSSKNNEIQMIFDVIQAAKDSDSIDIEKECSFMRTLFVSALKQSVFFRVNMESRFNTKNFNSSSFDDQLAAELCIGSIEHYVNTSRGARKRFKSGSVCTNQERSRLRSIIKQAKQQVNSSSNVSSDSQDSLDSARQNINQYLLNLNQVLQEYNQKRRELLAEKEQRFRQLSSNRKAQREKWHISKEYRQKLDAAKQEVFAKYQMTLLDLHKNELSFLIQSPGFQKETGLDKLAALVPKHLGLSGMQEEVLSHREDFPSLQLASNQSIQNAVKDVQTYSKKNIRSIMEEQKKTKQDGAEYRTRLMHTPHKETKSELDEWYSSRRINQLENLIMTSPNIIGSTLINNPQYSNMLCQAVKNIEEDEEKQELLRTTLMGGAIAGVLAVSVVAPFVGVVGIPALLTTAGVAVAITSIDIKLRREQIKKHRVLKEEMLNAYLSGVGDDQSIEQIRSEWKKAITEDIYSKWIMGLMVFDVTRTGLAIRKTLPDVAINSAKPTHLTVQVVNNKNIITSVQQNQDQLRALQSLMNTHTRSEIRDFFKVVALYPKNKQTEILAQLPDMSKTRNLDLQGLTEALRNAGITANIKKTLGRFATCATCKVKPGVKIKQKTNE